MKIPLQSLLVGLFLGILSAAPLVADTNSNSRPAAVPGSLNYLEGQASIGSQALASKSVGSTELMPGQSLATHDGKAEVLLTPGVFLRLGAHSTVKMISPNLTNTQVDLERGHAIVEVDEIHKENDIRIGAGGATARLLKTGLYDVDARDGKFRVFDGKAEVREGDQQATVKGGHELALSANPAGKLKTQKFNKKKDDQGDLYKWSSLRSAYLAEANVNAASMYANSGIGPWGPGWWGADWYWDPWFDTYTFIPGNGIFYSPFGWGFYSPWMAYAAPVYYGYGYGYGYPYGGYGGYRGPIVVHHFSPNVNAWGPGAHYTTSPHYNAATGIYRGMGSNGGFHSGAGRVIMGTPGGGFGRMGGGVGRMGGAVRGGGGFHGGGGGFHGGAVGGAHR